VPGECIRFVKNAVPVNARSSHLAKRFYRATVATTHITATCVPYFDQIGEWASIAGCRPATPGWAFRPLKQRPVQCQCEEEGETFFLPARAARRGRDGKTWLARPSLQLHSRASSEQRSRKGQSEARKSSWSRVLLSAFRTSARPPAIQNRGERKIAPRVEGKIDARRETSSPHPGHPNPRPLPACYPTRARTTSSSQAILIREREREEGQRELTASSSRKLRRRRPSLGRISSPPPNE
jgi:hypothetical protein